MNPTTSGRFRVHDRRSEPAVVDEGDGTAEANARAEFVLVELPDESIDPTDPEAADAYDPLYVAATGYEGDLGDRIASLDPGAIVDATLAWDDGTARFADLTVVRETRFRFADGVEGMFEAAIETWRRIRADGESVGSITTRSTDGEPNGALYLFADGSGSDAFAEITAGRLPIEPLIARVNDTRDDGTPREVFVLRPAAHEFVAVYVVFERDGVLARTVRDTYGLGDGLAAGLDEVDYPGGRGGPDADGGDPADADGGDPADADGGDPADADGDDADDEENQGPDADGFDLTDRI